MFLEEIGGRCKIVIRAKVRPPKQPQARSSLAFGASSRAMAEVKARQYVDIMVVLLDSTGTGCATGHPEEGESE